MSYSIMSSFSNYVSFGFGGMRQVCSSAVTTLSSVKESVVGRAIKKVVNENIFEAVGSETAVACLSKAVKWISSSELVRSQVVLPSVLKVATSYFGGGFIVQGALFTAGILGGYAGVRLSGSEERLIDGQDLLASYALKASQGSLLSAFIENSIGFPQGVLGFVAKLGFEALGFNARDIGYVAKQVANKKILNHLLCDHPEKLLASKVFEQVEAFRKKSPNDQVSFIISEKYIQHLVSIFLRLVIDFQESLKRDHELSSLTIEFEKAYQMYTEEQNASKKEEKYKDVKACKQRLYQKMKPMLVEDKQDCPNMMLKTELVPYEQIEETLLENVQKWLKSVEKNFCGLVLSSKEKVAAWFELLKVYLQLAFECLADSSMYMAEKCELAQDEVKKLYQAVSGVMCSFYKDKFGERITTFFDAQVQNQLQG